MTAGVALGLAWLALNTNSTLLLVGVACFWAGLAWRRGGDVDFIVIGRPGGTEAGPGPVTRDEVKGWAFSLAFFTALVVIVLVVPSLLD